jgi:hypothetical protein
MASWAMSLPLTPELLAHHEGEERGQRQRAEAADENADQDDQLAEEGPVHGGGHHGQARDADGRDGGEQGLVERREVTGCRGRRQRQEGGEEDDDHHEGAQGKTGRRCVGNVIDEVTDAREDPQALTLRRCGLPAGRALGPRLALGHVRLFLD